MSSFHASLLNWMLFHAASLAAYFYDCQIFKIYLDFQECCHHWCWRWWLTAVCAFPRKLHSLCFNRTSLPQIWRSSTPLNPLEYMRSASKDFHSSTPFHPGDGLGLWKPKCVVFCGPSFLRLVIKWRFVPNQLNCVDNSVPVLRQ